MGWGAGYKWGRSKWHFYIIITVHVMYVSVRFPKITVRVQSQNTGSKLGGVWGPKRAGSKWGYFTLTSMYNKSIVPSM